MFSRGGFLNVGILIVCMKVLFVCNQNKHRSKTAEVLFKSRFETRSAGLYNERPISAKELGWADVVVLMDEEQRIELARRFPLQVLKKRIVTLDVPDVFSFNQPELVALLKHKESLLV